MLINLTLIPDVFLIVVSLNFTIKTIIEMNIGPSNLFCQLSTCNLDHIPTYTRTYTTMTSGKKGFCPNYVKHLLGR